jgi:hypothetical protein
VNDGLILPNGWTTSDLQFLRVDRLDADTQSACSVRRSARATTIHVTVHRNSCTQISNACYLTIRGCVVSRDSRGAAAAQVKSGDHQLYPLTSVRTGRLGSQDLIPCFECYVCPCWHVPSAISSPSSACRNKFYHRTFVSWCRLTCCDCCTPLRPTMAPRSNSTSSCRSCTPQPSSATDADG